jgi:hypothetical protein
VFGKVYGTYVTARIKKLVDEVLACVEGLKHLINLYWCNPAILESNCSELLDLDKSTRWTLYHEGQKLLKIYQHN